MSNVLLIRNRQRRRRLSLRYLRASMVHLLEQELRVSGYHLVFYTITAAAMAQLNARYLGHEGPTDVITFDYADEITPALVHGEIFICLEMAESQAILFKTRWEEELVRYMIHGVLHLIGFDDLKPELKRKMKRAEDRLLRRLTELFPIRQLHIPAARGNLSIKP